MKIILISLGALIFLLAVGYIYGRWSFQNKLREARQNLSIPLIGHDRSEFPVISEIDLDPLPLPLKKWLRKAGVIGQKRTRLTKLKQSGLMRLKPEQSQWTQSQSEQIINVENPAFVWNVQMSIKGLPVLGIDQFRNGEGSMLITFLGLFPVVNVSHDPKISQSALQRFLGEIIWTPTAALNSYLQWTAIDDRSVKASMTINGITGDAIFYFSETGDLDKFVAMRFKDIRDEKPVEWHADVKEVKVFNGLRIPSAIEATWMLPEGAFTWFKFEITEISYE